MPPITPTTHAALELTDVGLRRGDDQVLTDITWRVQRDERWVVLGANGCGKTSLINLLTGYDMATAGEIRVGRAEFGSADWREANSSDSLTSPPQQQKRPFNAAMASDGLHELEVRVARITVEHG